MRVDASSRSRGDSSSSTNPTWRKNTASADEGAAGMVDRHERRIGDDVERLLAAIVGMRAPADIGEQASGVAQAAFVARLVEPRRRHETVGPGDQLLAMRGRARAQHVELARGRDQRILLALACSLEHGIEQALAHAERGDHHVLRLGDAHQVFQHQRRVGQAAAGGRRSRPRSATASRDRPGAPGRQTRAPPWPGSRSRA